MSDDYFDIDSSDMSDQETWRFERFYTRCTLRYLAKRRERARSYGFEYHLQQALWHLSTMFYLIDSYACSRTLTAALTIKVITTIETIERELREEWLQEKRRERKEAGKKTKHKVKRKCQKPRATDNNKQGLPGRQHN